MFPIAGTGHRPPTAFSQDPYSAQNFGKLVNFAKSKLKELLVIHTDIRIISGVALGWDQALAHAATLLQLPWDAYIPFEGQERLWPEASRFSYQRLLMGASTTRVVSPGGYAAWKMQARNEAMVHSADLILALWNGSKGGTGNCIQFAEKQGKPILNLWEDWIKERRQCL